MVINSLDCTLAEISLSGKTPLAVQGLRRGARAGFRAKIALFVGYLLSGDHHSLILIFSQIHIAKESQ